MTDYPYDFGNGYKVQTVFANKIEGGIYGDIYDFRSEVESAHPGAEILTGYCVFDEALGLVPDGCNDWNDSISAAIQDYEDHIIPLLEREERLDMNCCVFDLDDNFLYEVFFTAKCGWLQDYFDVDNLAQLEAIWDIGDSWTDPENFEDALIEAELSEIQINALVRDNVKVELVAIGEGLYGDYDSTNPNDVELLRFYVSVLRDGVWEEKEDASYCTQLPVSISAEETLAGLEILLDKFYDALSADIDVSAKKLGEEMSWLDLTQVSEHIISNNFSNQTHSEPTQSNVTTNLIKAMAAYGRNFNWCDSDIIESLVECGITYNDFKEAGFGYFAKNYFEVPSGKKPALSDQIKSASNRISSGFPSEKLSANKIPSKDFDYEH